MLIYLILAASVSVSWFLTKPLGNKKRLFISGAQICALSLLIVSNIYQHWLWYYSMHEAEHFVREMASERNWLGADTKKRDEIIGLVFSRAHRLAEPAQNVALAVEKVKSNEQDTNHLSSKQMP